MVNTSVILSTLLCLGTLALVHGFGGLGRRHGPPRDGMMRVGLVKSIHSMFCNGLPGPNFTRPRRVDEIADLEPLGRPSERADKLFRQLVGADAVEGDGIVGPALDNEASKSSSESSDSSDSSDSSSSSNNNSGSNSNSTEEVNELQHFRSSMRPVFLQPRQKQQQPNETVKAEEARLYRIVARAAANVVQGATNGVTSSDAECTALTARTQAWIDFRRANNMTCNGNGRRHRRPEIGEPLNSDMFMLNNTENATAPRNLNVTFNNIGVNSHSHMIVHEAGSKNDKKNNKKKPKKPVVPINNSTLSTSTTTTSTTEGFPEGFRGKLL